MSHNLFYNPTSNQYSFMSVKETAWHGLGQIVKDYPTSVEAIIHAGLDFTVEKRPLFTDIRLGMEGQDGSAKLSVPDYFATVRQDNNTVLGVVGNDYSVIQNKDAFTFFDSIVGGDGIFYETAGALGNGERIFITAKLPSYIRVGQDDLIENYLLLTTSHDGSGSITVAFTPVRVVCANTLAAALRNLKNVVRIKHTANAKQRLEQAHKVMGISNELTTQMDGIFNQWAKVKITDIEVQKLIQLAMVPNKEVLHNIQTGQLDDLSTCFVNMCDDVFEYAQSSPTQQLETTKGKLFGAYNAITGYFQNVRTYKTNEAKVKSILFGGTAQLRTQAAFDLCSAFAKNGSGAFQFN